MHEPFITRETDVELIELADVTIGLRAGDYRFEPTPRQRWFARFRLFVGGAPVSPETRELLGVFSGLFTALPLAVLLWVAIYQLLMWAL